MPASPAYCDYNAGAPLRPEARAAMAEAMDAANPSSLHAPGRKARAIVERARADIASHFGVVPARVFFTSGGTEAVAAALWGARAADPSLQLWAAEIEHECVLRQGVVRAMPAESSGRVSRLGCREALAAAAGTGIRPLVSLMLANNETGVVQPVAEIAALTREAGGLIHCDAAQAVGRIPVLPDELGVDYLTLSAHKFGGPQGVGVVILAEDAPYRARQSGGGQEFGLRAGTENVAAIAGSAAALDCALAELGVAAELAARRDAMESRLRAAVPAVRIHGADAERLPNTSCFGLARFPAQTQVMALDLECVYVGAGSACSSGRANASHVLRAMGVCEQEAGCAVRASFGWASTESDFGRLTEAWLEAVRRACPECIAATDGDRSRAGVAETGKEKTA